MNSKSFNPVATESKIVLVEPSDMIRLTEATLTGEVAVVISTNDDSGVSCVDAIVVTVVVLIVAVGFELEV
jgi:hypothetical protein